MSDCGRARWPAPPDSALLIGTVDLHIHTAPADLPGYLIAEIDTYEPEAAAAAPERGAGDKVTVGPRSVAVLRATA